MKNDYYNNNNDLMHRVFSSFHLNLETFLIKKNVQQNVWSVLLGNQWQIALWSAENDRVSSASSCSKTFRLSLNFNMIVVTSITCTQRFFLNLTNYSKPLKTLVAITIWQYITPFHMTAICCSDSTQIWFHTYIYMLNLKSSLRINLRTTFHLVTNAKGSSNSVRVIIAISRYQHVFWTLINLLACSLMAPNQPYLLRRVQRSFNDKTFTNTASYMADKHNFDLPDFTVAYGKLAIGLRSMWLL